MSEYQYYEFLAIDRPLDDAEQAEVRSLSTRARITATSFVNEYHWGDFKGDPNLLVERYYDAHLYVANWGTHRLLLRLPCDLLDPDVVDDYRVDHQVSSWAADDFTVLEFSSEDDLGEFDFDYDPETLLPAVIGVRAELAAGDLRPLYLAWLAAYGRWERDENAFERDADEDLEPPVPPGLGRLTASQRALADFLRLDDELLATAAQASTPIESHTRDQGEVADWVVRLTAAEKDQLLARVVLGEPARVRMELLRRFRDDTAPATPPPSRRTVGELLDTAARRRADRQRHLAAQRAEEEARRERERALARQRRLDELAEEKADAWSRVETLISTRKPAEYDAAVALLTELRALADRDNHHAEFASRAVELRRRHERKPSLIERLDKAGI